MATADDIFDQAIGNLLRLGLKSMPFTESPIGQQGEMLQKIFTGRDNELQKVFSQFTSQDRRRILVYGRLGIGKSALVLKVLEVLGRKRPKMLTTYISLPVNLDLPTTALIALAKAMPDDDWAQKQLYQMGIPIEKILKERSSTISANMVLGATTSEKDLTLQKLQYPTVSLNTLLEQAQRFYPQGILIAIDDLDKQNPSQVRKLMHDAQGMLKGKAWFILTGHPMGMTGDLLTSERGLFDLQLELEELDSDNMYQMLINYLNSVRIDNDCTDPENPRSVLPFLPETAKHFCDASLGKPRMFNRLGNVVLSTAANLKERKITSEILTQGLQAAQRTRLHQAALSVQEERVRLLLKQRGTLSDDSTTMADLESLGYRSFVEIMPILEKLEKEDLAYQLKRDDSMGFAALNIAEDGSK